ncbi:hypothetical protein BAE44_0001478 [Dichanthelium oligosanthes]|uniref:Uncharacterized protein n=1 Tax=Dichanthelium oligosanthes TaxID=888268 RepID=A0A1E5WK36_9POAL|nr:hypothetical protein BAE44_0001478 [Dichanthelium oligosanthes]
MSLSTRRLLLLVASLLLVVLLVGSARSAGAARPALPVPEAAWLNDGEAVQGRGQATAVERTTKEAVEMLMARLPAGPSQKGPGH